MDIKVKTASGNALTLGQKNYLAAGGEASIYTLNGMAYKLYHEPDKKMLPTKKIQELSLITNPNVIIPKELVYNSSNGKTIGYTTKFINDAEPLLKFFTKTFKTDNNIDYQMINELVKQMQLIVTDIHNVHCLVVDLNELNVLVKISTTCNPYFIDTDSYSTPSFKATAIMDSVRDRRVSVIDKNNVLHYNPDTLSDWFSWGILSFWAYSNIHPFRGSHPDYRPADKKKQMDDGISVFHKGVKVPPCVNNFNLIPKRHLEWFKDTFLNNNRSVPPLPDSVAPLAVPTAIVTIKSTDKIEVTEISSYPDNITFVYQFMGVYYVVTKTHIYAGTKEIGAYKSHKALVCSANDGTIILATQNGTKITFSELTKSKPVGTVTSNVTNGMFARNGAIYTIANDKLVENSFTAFGNTIIHRINEIENVSVNSSVMYDGCVIQNLLGKKFLTLPYKIEYCFSKHIPELDDFRIIDAKSDKNVTVVIGEKSSIYYRFIITFNKDYNSFHVREIKDVALGNINFTVSNTGLCLLLADNEDDLELFVDPKQIQILNNPPFDSSMKLFSNSDGVFFINGNSFHQIKKK